MSMRTESRVTGRFAVVDQHGVRHTIEERTDFMHGGFMDGSRSAPVAGLKEYLMDGRHVNKHDDNAFETPGGALQLTRV